MPKFKKSTPRLKVLVVVVTIITLIMAARASSDNNKVFDPCMDTETQQSDGFTFGVAFSDKQSFFADQVQLSPCDSRLSLSSKKAVLAVFRPKVDEISLLTINNSAFDLVSAGGYMVAFAGRKYAARSVPMMVSENGMMATSFTLVLEFQKGILQNMYWKKFGCDSCPKGSVCMGGETCGVPMSKCKSKGGQIDCNLGIQVAFSGTDKNLESLNSWYEVSHLRQYSLYGLYSGVRNSIIGQLDGYF